MGDLTDLDTPTQHGDVGRIMGYMWYQALDLAHGLDVEVTHNTRASDGHVRLDSSPVDTFWINCVRLFPDSVA
jgi:hypothetical protein